MTLVASSVAAACTQGPDAPGRSRPYTLLDDQASQLRSQFNRNLGAVRLLFVVDPICLSCLRGLDDMNRELLRNTSDPRLQVFVVHEPVLGKARFIPRLRSAASSDVAKAAQLLQNPNVEHYWNPSGEFGRLLAKSLGLKNDSGPVYACDVWLLYGPEAKWTSVGPPPPELLMHQFGALRGTAFPRFDGQVLAERTRQLLARLSSVATAAEAN